MVAFDISQQKAGAGLEASLSKVLINLKSTKLRGQAGQNKLIIQVYPLYLRHVTPFLPRFYSLGPNIPDHGREGILFTFSKS